MTTPPQGRLTLTVHRPDGRLAARRDARNLVVKDGASLIANLFAGKAATPIDRIRIGFGQATADVTSKALVAPPAPIHDAVFEAPLKPENFAVDASGAASVTVRVNAPFTPNVDIAGVSEAGLFAGDVLYNQVVFEPITMSAGHVITFFWQIDFPFGR